MPIPKKLSRQLTVYTNNDVALAHPFCVAIPYNVDTLVELCKHICIALGADRVYRFLYSVTGEPLWSVRSCLSIGTLVMSAKPGFLPRTAQDRAAIRTRPVLPVVDSPSSRSTSPMDADEVRRVGTSHAVSAKLSTSSCRNGQPRSQSDALPVTHTARQRDEEAKSQPQQPKPKPKQSGNRCSLVSPNFATSPLRDDHNSNFSPACTLDASPPAAHPSSDAAMSIQRSALSIRATTPSMRTTCDTTQPARGVSEGTHRTSPDRARVSRCGHDVLQSVSTCWASAPHTYRRHPYHIHRAAWNTTTTTGSPSSPMQEAEELARGCSAIKKLFRRGSSHGETSTGAEAMRTRRPRHTKKSHISAEVEHKDAQQQQQHGRSGKAKHAHPLQEEYPAHVAAEKTDRVHSLALVGTATSAASRLLYHYFDASTINDDAPDDLGSRNMLQDTYHNRNSNSNSCSSSDDTNDSVADTEKELLSFRMNVCVANSSPLPPLPSFDASTAAMMRAADRDSESESARALSLRLLLRRTWRAYEQLTTMPASAIMGERCCRAAHRAAQQQFRSARRAQPSGAPVSWRFRVCGPHGSGVSTMTALMAQQLLPEFASGGLFHHCLLLVIDGAALAAADSALRSLPTHRRHTCNGNQPSHDDAVRVEYVEQGTRGVNGCGMAIHALYMLMIHTVFDAVAAQRPSLRRHVARLVELWSLLTFPRTRRSCTSASAAAPPCFAQYGHVAAVVGNRVLGWWDGLVKQIYPVLSAAMADPQNSTHRDHALRVIFALLPSTIAASLHFAGVVVVLDSVDALAAHARPEPHRSSQPLPPARRPTRHRQHGAALESLVDQEDANDDDDDDRAEACARLTRRYGDAGVILEILWRCGHEEGARAGYHILAAWPADIPVSDCFLPPPTAQMNVIGLLSSADAHDGGGGGGGGGSSESKCEPKERPKEEEEKEEEASLLPIPSSLPLPLPQHIVSQGIRYSRDLFLGAPGYLAMLRQVVCADLAKPGSLEGRLSGERSAGYDLRVDAGEVSAALAHLQSVVTTYA